jgi:DNA-directed RNA polymerase subunit alpha
MLEPNFVTEKLNLSLVYGKFILSPLPAGFGYTIGHALRRVLLSSIPGVAVTYVKINNIVHPFSTISGIRESVLDIILNIKLLRFKIIGNGPFEMILSVKGKRKITGKDFKGGGIEVVNNNQYITEITDDKAKLDIALIIEKGWGYSPSEEKEKKEFSVMPVDSIFSPVKKINYSVEGTRVGRKTNFDKLILEIWTDETVSPEEILRQGATILSQYFSYILSGKDVKKPAETATDLQEELAKTIDKKVYQTIIDELDLPTRVINALLREKIETVEDLVKQGKESIINFKGVGKKSVELIQKELEKLGVPFN